MKKNTRNLIMILSMMFITIFAVMSVDAAGAEHHYKGDVNRDDKVDIEDVRMVQSFMTSSDYYIPKDNKKYADMNDDGKINIVDLMLLKRTAAGRIPIAEDPALTTTVSTEVTTTTETTVTAVTTEVSSEEQTVTSASSTTQQTTTVSTAESTAATTVTTTTTTVTSTSATTTTSTTSTTEATEATTTVVTTAESVTSVSQTAATTEDTGSDEPYQIAPSTVDRMMFDATVDNGNWVGYKDSDAFEDATDDPDTSIFSELLIPEITELDKEYTAKIAFKESTLMRWLGLELKTAQGSSINAWNTNITVTELIIDGVSYDLTNDTDLAKITLIGYGTPVESGAELKSVEVKFTVTNANKW